MIKHLAAQSGHLPEESSPEEYGRSLSGQGDSFPWFWDSMGVWFALDSWLSVGVGVGQLFGFGWAESNFQRFWLSPEERELSERKWGGGGGVLKGPGRSLKQCMQNQSASTQLTELFLSWRLKSTGR